MAKDLVFSLSLANLCFLWPWNLLLSRSSQYFLSHPPLRVEYLAIILNVFSLGICLFLGLLLVRRLQNKNLIGIAHYLFLIVLLIPALSIRKHFPFLTKAILNTIGSHGALLVFCLIAFLVLTLFIWRRQKIFRLANIFVFSLSPLLIFNIFQSSFYIFTGPKPFEEKNNAGINNLSFPQSKKKYFF